MIKKICLACSVGGHLTQIRQLDKLYKKYDYFFVTENTPLTKDLKRKEKVYLIPLANRKQWDFIFRLLYNSFFTLAVLIRERPDVVISTGALSAVPCCFLAKILRKKLVYIESFAKIYTPTVTGRVMYKISDMFIIQWNQLKQYYPKAVYGGSIY